ncbi:sensor histidine kinase [Nocardioides albus]|uniref:Two-component system sensor histidine kinase DesK n=1 Tax=Nocardioides albus TaxID=1841 RepID=A0A7W5A9L9_9ACTN|nr:histidine kinase [Nocardioides albus]MBB3092136.1 two-component system sensor histidine kinase DesK [Nocardioides albus]
MSGLRCNLQRYGGVLVWLPVLLLFPLLNLSGDVMTAAGQVVLVLALAAAAVALVLTGRVAVLLTALVVLTLLAAMQGEGWQTVWGVLAIVSPAVLRGWRLLIAIAAATAGAAVSIAVIEGVGSGYLLSVGGILLSGLTTTSFLRLIETVDQLRRTREELARTAVAEERARMSRDLHDLLGHTLSVMVVKAEAVRRLAARDPEAAAAHAADIEEVGRAALADVRAAVDQMKTLSLAEELDGARRALDAAGIRTSVAAAPAEVPDIAGQALAWVVREGATNVLRHSGAASCRFELTEDGGQFRLAVVDDGVGGPAVPAGPAERSGGIEGLRQRLRAVDGRLDVRPGADGFRLEARVPAS